MKKISVGFMCLIALCSMCILSVRAEETQFEMCVAQIIDRESVDYTNKCGVYADAEQSFILIVSPAQPQTTGGIYAPQQMLMENGQIMLRDSKVRDNRIVWEAWRSVDYTRKKGARIELEDGNVMKKDGTVLSLSPYDMEKARTFDCATQTNIGDPTTLPGTIVTYYKMPFIDSGITVYDKNGNLSDAPVTLTVTNMGTGETSVVEQYNKRFTSAVNTNKSFRRLIDGTYRLDYSASIDGQTITAQRYVKVRYLRGDCNMDGLISMKPDTEHYKSDFTAIKNYVLELGDEFKSADGIIDQEFVNSICDMDRQMQEEHTVTLSDFQVVKEWLTFEDYANYQPYTFIQDVEPIGGASNWFINY